MILVTLLSVLDGTKQAGHAMYTARCTGGDDRSPSLAIKKRADKLLSRWVDLLNDERDRGLTRSQEQTAYELLADFLRRP